ncbi:hypothetical protein JYK18_27470 [Amycolatopsis sp. 195334CR]|nr:hypothetical protein [Amycolatopsis sp. 195334CR]
MTIYSQHANRGKQQILATYRGSNGVVSLTVTSVEDAALAAPIVDALNRISACATVPVSVWDERGGHFRSYPAGHLAALTDPGARRHLIEGAHSLWYEQAMALLHRALADLDTALAAVPAPVRTAVGAELAAESRALQEELAEYTDGIEPSEPEKRRFWEFQAPLVEAILDPADREALDNLERELDRTQLARAIADLRLLLDAHAETSNGEAQLLIDRFEISDDPYSDGGYFLNVQAPIPDRPAWNVELCRWVPDNRTDGDTGEPVLDCARSDPPAVEEIVALLDRSDGQADVLAAWAATPVGDALAGTAFVVTQRYGD